MKKIMAIAFGFLMMTAVSISAQKTIKVAKDSTKAIVVTTTTKVDSLKTEMKTPKDATTTTVITTTTVEPVKTEMKSVDLPQAVKDLGTNFKSQGWDTAETAYVVKGIIFYVVTFKNPTTGESKSINIDAKGNIVKE
jgi:hypothetical protein